MILWYSEVDFGFWFNLFSSEVKSILFKANLGDSKRSAISFSMVLASNLLICKVLLRLFLLLS